MAFHWRNDTHNLCHQAVFILNSVRPFGLFVQAYLSYTMLDSLFFIYQFLVLHGGESRHTTTTTMTDI